MTARVLLYVGLLFCSVGAVFAQQSAPGRGCNITIDSLLVDTSAYAPVVKLVVTVSDSAGEGVSGLFTSNFAVKQSQSDEPPIELNDRGFHEGVNAVLCLDVSTAMSDVQLQQMKNAVSSFIDRMQPVDSISVAVFGTDYTGIVPFSNNKPRLEQAVRGITAGEDSSSLFYAVYRSIEQFQTPSEHFLERRLVVVVTDGTDESTTAYSADNCIEKAKEAGVIICTIGFNNRDAQYLWNLETLADETGGIFSDVSDDSSMLVYRLSETMTFIRSRYTLQFALPSGRASNSFTLAVTTDNSRTEVPLDLSGIAPSFVCPQCGLVYNTASERQSCIESHRLYCPYCDEEFPDSNALETHILDQHHWVCPECAEVFRSEAELSTHILEAEHYKCSKCDSVFISLTALNDHQERCRADYNKLYLLLGVLLLLVVVLVVLMAKNRAVDRKLKQMQRESEQRAEEQERKNKERQDKVLSAQAEALGKKNEIKVSSPPAGDVQKISGLKNMSNASQYPATGNTASDSRKTTIFSAGTLTALSGPDRGRIFPLTESVVTIGRSAQNMIVVPADDVSRKHAVLRYKDGLFQLTDKGSSNGTYVNGMRIKNTTILKNGDHIRFGARLEFRFEGKQ